MKNLLYSIVLAFGVVMSSCSSDESASSGGNSLSGDANIAMNTVGNVFSLGDIQVGSTPVPCDGKMTIVSNEGGVITAKLEVSTQSLKQVPAFATILAGVQPQHLDPDGNISTELKFKSTSEGILDYANMDEKPHMLIRYADGVGTEYTITKSSGRKLTRRIVAKSSEDDFPYGFMYIKTTTVESDINTGGIRKAVYRANHKFGIVYVELTLEDGSTMSAYLYSVH